MIARLSPLVLQELGLVAAIRKEAKDLSKSTGVKTRVELPDDLGRFGPEAETAIYRVVQEALHNVAKHAQAKNVAVQVGREQNNIKLLVEDDGIGFVQKGVSRGRSFGLAGMKERIAALGGTVRVRTGKGRGTRIEVTVPDAAAVVQLPVSADAVYPNRSVAAGSSLAS